MRVQDARFFRDSTETRKIRWLRAKPGAGVLPIRQAFGYPVWDGPHKPPLAGPGVVPTLGDFAHSLTSPLPGDHYEGPNEWWLIGAPGSASLAPPPSCGVIDRVERVGFVIGAKEVPPPSYVGRVGIEFGAKEVPPPSYVGRVGLIFGAIAFEEDLHGSVGIIIGLKDV